MAKGFYTADVASRCPLKEAAGQILFYYPPNSYWHILLAKLKHKAQDKEIH